MRYYLDTNILIFLLWQRQEELSADVGALFADYQNIMLTSTVCVHEIIHLFQIGKLSLERNRQKADVAEISDWLNEIGVEVRQVDMHHLQTLARLKLFPDHRDPNDRLIIAQAICDRIPLVSSDRKFSRYRSEGLNLIVNRR